MSDRGVSSEGTSLQSMTTKEICIFLAIDDLTSYKIVSRILQLCTHEVLSTGKAADVLKDIQGRKEHVSAVFTNVHRLGSDGFTILRNIKNSMNLQIIVMSPDNEKIVLQEKGSGFVAYVIKFLNVNDIKNLLQSALEIEKMENLDEKQGGELKASGTSEGNTRTISIDEVTRVHYKRCREESSEENEETKDYVSRVHSKRRREESLQENEETNDGEEDGPSEKKPRMAWTREMHQKFLEAIEILGYDKAFPKKIVEVMDVPGLTRENVASHLQKYRMCLKRAQDTDPILHGMNKKQRFSSSVSPLHSNYSYGNSYLGRNVYGTYNRPPFQRTLPNVLYPSATMYPNRCQMDVRNSQSIHGNDIMNNQYGYAPNNMLRSNFRVYNDTKKNVLMNIEGRSALDANRPSRSDPCAPFLGFRLTRDGKSVEVGGKCISSNIQTTGSETLPTTLANGNTGQLGSILNETQASLLSVEDYGYSEVNLIQPAPSSANHNLAQEPFSGQSSILENEQIDFYYSTPPENKYKNRYFSTPNEIIPQQQSLLSFYQAPSGISAAQSSTPNITSLQRQLFMPHCRASGDALGPPCSIPLEDPILQQLPSQPLYEVLSNDYTASDPILQQLPSPPLKEVLSSDCTALDPILQQLPLSNEFTASVPILEQLPSPPLNEVLSNDCTALDQTLQQLLSPPLYEVLSNDCTAQSSTTSGNFIHQHQHSVPSVSYPANVDTFQTIPTPSTQEFPPPSLTSTRDELEDILSGIGDDFWSNDINDIINNINC